MSTAIATVMMSMSNKWRAMGREVVCFYVGPIGARAIVHEAQQGLIDPDHTITVPPGVGGDLPFQLGIYMGFPIWYLPPSPGMLDEYETSEGGGFDLRYGLKPV